LGEEIKNMSKKNPLKFEPRERHGRLVVIREHRGRRKKRMVIAECDCGKTIKAEWDNIRSGHTSSCGCLSRWNPNKSIRRLNQAIQYEINQMNKYQSEYKQWAIVMDWLEQKAKELNSYTTLGGGNGEVGTIPACLMQ
jgi:hypothetical protein